LASPDPTPESRQFPARFAAVADTAEFALGFCERHGVSRENALRLRLIVEELFTNSIRHGYRGECDTPVRVELALIEGHPALMYEDSAPPFDPLARLTTLGPADVATLGAPPGDGLGLFLIGKLAYGAHHAYEDGHNRLWLVMRTT
jgi:anti-sigma regulatory factor (Ser/Thr protein kinase)